MTIKFKNIICLVLVLAMCVSLAACGSSSKETGKESGSSEKNTAPAETQEYVYASEFSTIKEDTKDYIYVRHCTDKGMYYSSWEKIGEAIPEGVIPRYEGEYDVYSTYLYFLGYDGKTEKVKNYEVMPRVQNEEELRDFSSGSDLSGICFTDDGFVTIENVYTSWFEGDENVPQYSDEYWQNQKYEQKYYIRWFDMDGTEKSCAPIEVQQDEWLDAYRMQLDDMGNVVLSSGGGLRAIAPDGSDSYRIESADYIDSIIRFHNGKLGVSVYGEQQMLYTIDTAAHKLIDPRPINFDIYNALQGNDEYDFFYSNGSSFYGYKMDSSESEKLFSWISCDVNGSNVNVLNVDRDGAVTGMLNSWDNETETYDFEIVKVAKVPYESVPHKETITMAAIYLDYDVQEMVVDFNRRSDKYRIEVKDYSEYNNEKDGWDAGQTKLNTEIMAGNIPDILCLNNLNYTQLAAKGILEDLYPYIDADKELNKKDFFPNVLKAREIDGKLYGTVAGFYINSAVGAAKIVGDTPGWTYDELNEALTNMPEGCEVFDRYVTRYDILNTCLSLDMADFVDWGTGKCSFDSEQFVDLLEFAAKFPAEFDWENYDYSMEQSTEDRLAQGRQLLVQTSAFGLNDIFYNNYAQFLGGKITYIGYPTMHGTGNMISFDSSGYAMSSRSEHKDVIWDFLRVFFTKDFQSKGYLLPSRIDVFDANAEKAMTVEYQKDENDNFLLDEEGEKIPVPCYTIWNETTGKVEELYALTQEQVDQLRELVETTTKVANYDQSITGIVTEEAEAFFQGQKSAQEVAKLIQSKANIYVNEQR